MLRIALITVVAIALLAFTCQGKYSVPLQAGTNNVTYPGATMPVGDAVVTILPQLHGGSVQYWTGSVWLVWTPDAAYDTLLTLEHGKPYAITLKANAIWTGKLP